MPLDDEQRRRIVDIAKSWIGTPYHYNARVKGGGVDCGMLLLEVFEESGLIGHIDVGEYSPQWNLHRGDELYLKWINKFCKKTHYAIPLPGDIAMFQFGRAVSHGAIVIEWPCVIHSYSGIGVIEEDATKDTLNGRLRGVYTLCTYN